MIIIKQRSRSAGIYYNKINNSPRSSRLLWNEFTVSVRKVSQWRLSVKFPAKKKLRVEATLSLALASINLISQTKWFLKRFDWLQTVTRMGTVEEEGGSVLVSTGEMSCALGTLDSAGTNELPRHAPCRFSHTDASCAVSHAIKI